MKRSVLLLIAALIGTAYSVYVVSYFGKGAAPGSTDAEAIGAGIATLLVLPHIVLTIVATLFAWLGFLFKFKWAALVAGICYAVAMVCFLAYFMFVIVEMILSFVAYARMKKQDA